MLEDHEFTTEGDELVLVLESQDSESRVFEEQGTQEFTKKPLLQKKSSLM